MFHRNQHRTLLIWSRDISRPGRYARFASVQNELSAAFGHTCRADGTAVGRYRMVVQEDAVASSKNEPDTVLHGYWDLDVDVLNRGYDDAARCIIDNAEVDIEVFVATASECFGDRQDGDAVDLGDTAWRASGDDIYVPRMEQQSAGRTGRCRIIDVTAKG